MSNDTDTVVLIPEVRIPADFAEDVARARKLVRKLEPKLAELRTLTLNIRDTYDDALCTLGAAGIPIDGDDVYELVGEAIGWTGGEGIWNIVSDLVEGLDDLQMVGLTNAEIRRGGERDIPVGTRTQIALPVEEGGAVVTMEVVRRPGADGLYSLRLVFGDETKRYSAPHDEVKAGVVAHKVAKESAG